MKDMLSNSRKSEFVFPRHIAMYICRQHNRSYPHIAFYFRRRNHTTVIHAIKRISKLISEESELKAKINRIVELIKSEKV